MKTPNHEEPATAGFGRPASAGCAVLVQKITALLNVPNLEPETKHLIEMAIEAQTTGKMPALNRVVLASKPLHEALSHAGLIKHNAAGERQPAEPLKP